MTTVQQMADLGKKHAQNGLKLTPFDCQHVDAVLFAETRGMDKFSGARHYNTMRGAFNRAWNAEYSAALTS